ncbi:unnamed protein product [Miscanthus lutarioriparius]|uniref:Uncharacterized protein n=1 Tax=Miscanthus lutarioriparius TaxID=422564 RepID=A0A811NA72_9POAL|nr:unnamed protein product [Miscanthus lutarioriparius]
MEKRMRKLRIVFAQYQAKCDGEWTGSIISHQALQVAFTDEDPRAGEPPALSSEVIKNLAPEALSDEGLPRKNKLVEAIGQSKATQEDKDAMEKANKSNNKQQ